MSVLYLLLLAIAGTTTMFYCFKLLKWSLIWNMHIAEKIENYDSGFLKVSVLIAVRNEELNIEPCLKLLLMQQYPHDLLEIIVSDDFSTDNTVNIVEQIVWNHQSVSLHSIKLIRGSGDAKGKKAALERAINIATGEIIITTDADCEMNKNWVSSFANVFRQTNANMVTGFVKISPVTGFFAGLQALDILSLSGTGAASVVEQKPLMCNGANLAFKKLAFVEAGGYAYGKNDPSGDDTYLMLKIADTHPESVVFNTIPESVIVTPALKSLKGLFHQRIRWASKVRNYSESYVKHSGVLIFTMNMTLVLTLFTSLMELMPWVYTAIIWILKWLVDFIFLYSVCVFAKQKKLLFLFLPAQLLYPLYNLSALLLTLFKVQYKWKGRDY